MILEIFIISNKDIPTPNNNNIVDMIMIISMSYVYHPFLYIIDCSYEILKKIIYKRKVSNVRVKKNM